MKRDLSAIDRDIGQDWSRIIQEAFKHGIDCDIIQGGLLPGKPVQGLYEVSDVQNYVIGSRRITPDGRVFRYAKSGGICYTGQGSAIYPEIAFFSDCKGALKATDTQITFAGKDYTKDALKGGYITIYGNPGGAPNNADCPHRLIVGNNLCKTADLILDLDGPVGRIVDDEQGCEVYHNPYSDLRLGSRTTESFAGLAAAYVSAADKYFWVQTWGPVWVALQSGSTSNGLYRDVYFRHDGSIQVLGTDETYDKNKQRAGFILPPGLAALVMLQISP